MGYSIKQFRALNKPELIVLTQHSRKRFEERGVKLADICNAIATGMIIEEYPNDYPYPSCLILGRSGKNALHVCASTDNSYIFVITAYFPDSEKWESDLKTRKEKTL